MAKRQQSGGHIKAPIDCPSFASDFPRVYPRVRVRARGSPRGSRRAASTSRDSALIPVEPVLCALHCVALRYVALRGQPWTRACAYVRVWRQLPRPLSPLRYTTGEITSRHLLFRHDRVIAFTRYL